MPETQEAKASVPQNSKGISRANKKETAKIEKPREAKSAQKPAAKKAEPVKETKSVQKSVMASKEVSKQQSPDNVVYVGKKPTMSYVMAVMTQLNSGQKEVYVKSRGRSISRAVDVVEAVKNKFLKDVKTEVKISTEEIKDKEGKNLNVSVINIKLSK